MNYVLFCLTRWVPVAMLTVIEDGKHKQIPYILVSCNGCYHVQPEEKLGTKDRAPTLEIIKKAPLLTVL